MSLEPCLPVTREPHIREIEITLLRTIDPEHPEGPQSVQFLLTLDDQDDQPMAHRDGNLVPHLQADPDLQHWIADLVQFMDEMWALAEEKVLPP